jgi:hypothetical protein
MLHLMHCTKLCLAHLYSYTLDCALAEPKSEIQVEHSLGKYSGPQAVSCMDTNLALYHGLVALRCLSDLSLWTLLLEIGRYLWLGIDVGHGRWPSGWKITWRPYVPWTWTFGRPWLSWRLGGVLWWKVETVGWEGRRVVYGKLVFPRL